MSPIAAVDLTVIMINTSLVTVGDTKEEIFPNLRRKTS